MWRSAASTVCCITLGLQGAGSGKMSGRLWPRSRTRRNPKLLASHSAPNRDHSSNFCRSPRRLSDRVSSPKLYSFWKFIYIFVSEARRSKHYSFTSQCHSASTALKMYSACRETPLASETLRSQAALSSGRYPLITLGPDSVFRVTLCVRDADFTSSTCSSAQLLYCLPFESFELKRLIAHNVIALAFFTSLTSRVELKVGPGPSPGHTNFFLL